MPDNQFHVMFEVANTLMCQQHHYKHFFHDLWRKKYNSYCLSGMNLKAKKKCYTGKQPHH
jgi:hypothetical protein